MLSIFKKLKLINDRKHIVQILDKLKDIREIININDPLEAFNTTGISEIEKLIYFYCSPEEVKRFPLKTVKINAEICKNHFKWTASLKEYNEIYNKELTDFLNKEVITFVSLYEEKKYKKYSLKLMKYEPVFENLKSILSESINTYGYITPGISNKALEILKQFMISVNTTELGTIDSVDLDEALIEKLLMDRIDFEIEFINKCINNESISDIYDKVISNNKESKIVKIESPVELYKEDKNDNVKKRTWSLFEINLYRN